ncbi:helix-turn-helix domain-containing protein [Anaerotruncus rubiinfantis]|uniref:helix-turn-helix domain-containing protein n=1 Tax=Anaerotruncus rubiinfantis TaxID=1720200 RepID=UPI00083285BC|nr:helix-turn-helix transcriptional regulator [Anaerotruncus rubiinfantis]
MGINKKLKDRRLELGLTLEDVGKIVGVGKSTVRKWETGDIENMRRDKIALLAKALQVSPSFIMEWNDEKPTTVSDDGLWNSLSTDPTKLMLARWIAGLDQVQLERVLKLLDAALLSPKE